MCEHIEYNMAKVFRVSLYTAAKFRSFYLNVFTDEVLTIGYLGEEQLLVPYHLWGWRWDMGSL